MTTPKELDKGVITSTSNSPRYSSDASRHEKASGKVISGPIETAPGTTEPSSHAIISLFKRRKDKLDPDDIATQPSVYDDPAQAQFFQPSPRYGNLHRFDPGERWTYREEKVG